MSSSDASSSQETRPVRRGLHAATVYLLTHKMECVMWISRVSTMIFTLNYLLPISSGFPFIHYYKALIANMATSVIRLNQRLPRFEFSKAYLALVLQEDSCHYIMYSIIFIFSYPATLVLLPVFLFAFLHSTSFTLKVFRELGYGQSSVASVFSNVVSKNSRGILGLIAYAEIFLMPFSVFSLIIGKGSLLTPFIYYRFLSLRYQSKRNPYTREVFFKLRLSIEVLANQPAVPDRVRRLCRKFVGFVCRLAPPVPTQ